MKKTGSRSSILDKFVDRVGGSSLPRKDISVIAYTLLGDENAARVIATYMGDPPKFDEIKTWAIEMVSGKVKVLPETLLFHDTLPYPMMSFAVEANREKKPLEETLKDNDRMVRVTANRYLDVDLGVTWAVEDINGRKFLVRVQPDGLRGALDGSINYKGPKTWKAAKESLAQVVQNDFIVHYLRPDLSVGIGKVIEVKEDGMVIVKDEKTKDVFERPNAAILNVLSVTGELSPEEKKKVYDYMAQILGPELAKEITS
jgi:hypothetical protein